MRWALNNLDVIGGYAVAHLAQALPPIALSLILSLPLGFLATRWRLLRGPISTGAALLYAIPSLPLFIVLPMLIGTGLRSVTNIVVALTLYGLALMVPATVDGLRQVDPYALQAADALGYGQARRFLTVELPLAGPTMLAGLRVVAVSTVSLVTVGAVLGVPNLGVLFTDGFQRGIVASIVSGIVATTALALLIDAALVAAGWLLWPWARRRRAA